MKNRMINDLRFLGIKEGDCVLVHTSFNSLGKGISPDEVIEVLQTAVGINGTLVLPALSWENVNKETPVFDVRTTPACIGFLPEYFRHKDGVMRSVHPTHSCSAIGKKQEEFVSLHCLDATPVGSNSPFRILARNDGKILFLGCTSSPNTSMHGVEETVVPDYLFGDDINYSLTGYDGNTYNKVYHTHGFAHTIQRYERMETLLNQYEMSKGKVLQAACVLMSSSAVWEKGKQALRSDSHFFVDTY